MGILKREQWIELNELFSRFPDMEKINVGKEPFDGTGDTHDEALMKVFRNLIRLVE